VRPTKKDLVQKTTKKNTIIGRRGTFKGTLVERKKNPNQEYDLLGLGKTRRENMKRVVNGKLERENKGTVQRSNVPSVNRQKKAQPVF